MKQDVLPVFYGAQKIPFNFLIHDVCVWIKKFFRVIKKPLFIDANCEIELIKLVGVFDGDVLFEQLQKIIRKRLSASHLGALSYLMRCLQEVCLFIMTFFIYPNTVF